MLPRGVEIRGCRAASEFLMEKRNAQRGFGRKVINKAAVAGDLPALNADEFGRHGSVYIFDSEDLLQWSRRKDGVRHG